MKMNIQVYNGIMPTAIVLIVCYTIYQWNKFVTRLSKQKLMDGKWGIIYKKRSVYNKLINASCMHWTLDILIHKQKVKLTLAGPRIIPFHIRKSMSSSFSKPQLTLPSPLPFCPCSSSSKRRKFRGTWTTKNITQLEGLISLTAIMYTSIISSKIGNIHAISVETLKLVNRICNLLSTCQSPSRRQATRLLFQNF